MNSSRRLWIVIAVVLLVTGVGLFASGMGAGLFSGDFGGGFGGGFKNGRFSTVPKNLPKIPSVRDATKLQNKRYIPGQTGAVQTPPEQPKDPKATNRIVVYPVNAKKIITVSPGDITTAKPYVGSQFEFCVEGTVDAQIKSALVWSLASNDAKKIQIFIGDTPVSDPITVKNDWSGDFLTFKNYVIPASTCQMLTVKIIQITQDAAWQKFAFKGAVSNLPVTMAYTKPLAAGTVEEKNGWPTSELHGQHLIYKPVNAVGVHSTALLQATKSDLHYKVGTESPPYADFPWYTLQNSTATIKSIDVVLDSPTTVPVPVRVSTVLVAPEWKSIDDVWFGYMPGGSNWVEFDKLVGNVSGITLVPGVKTTIPMNWNNGVSIPPNTFATMRIAGDPNAPATPTNFTIKLVGVTTSASLLDGTQSGTQSSKSKTVFPYSSTKIFIDEDIVIVPTIKINANPRSGIQSWHDATEASTNAVPYSDELLSLSFSNPFSSPPCSVPCPTPSPVVRLKKATFSIKGTFSKPLTIVAQREDFADGSPNKVIGTYTVASGGTFALPDIDFTGYLYITFHLKPYTAPLTASFAVKPTITAMSFEKISDGSSIPALIGINNPNGSYQDVPFVIPHKLGIANFAPTALFKTYDGNESGTVYVSLDSLPKDQEATFQMNHTCFKSQNYAIIKEFTYNHMSREKSPFKNIVLEGAGEGQSGIYMKSDDWTKEMAHFTLTKPLEVYPGSNHCFTLKVIAPLEPVEEIWFDLKSIKAVTKQAGLPVPVFVDSLPLEQSPVKGSVFTFY